MNKTKSTDNNYHKRIGNTNSIIITSFTIYKLMNIFTSSS